MKKILFLLIALASLTACSDDVVESVSSSSTRMNADVAYLTVKIIDVGSLTRATDGGYQNGAPEEYYVDNAYFYFYDEDGLFVSRAEVWDGGEVTNPDGTNIGFEGNTVVVLKGLTDTKFPRYMVTVLNKPDGFESSPYYEPATTLDEFQTLLASNDNTGIRATSDDEGYFVMSTSSYVAVPENRVTYDGTPYYFVTEILEEAFLEEPIGSTSANPVEVYVERLAAKVEVDVSTDLSQTAATITDENEGTHTAYLLTENIIGDDNVETEEDIYIEFQGWALNATARQSYIVKNIESTDVWTNTAISLGTGWTWNVPTDFRSYWGKSYNYGIDAAYPTTNINPFIEYPEGQVANYDENESSDDSNDWLNPYLKYTSLLADNLYSLDEDADNHYEYCAENTNTPEVLRDSNSSAITNVLLKAQAWIINNVDGEDVASPITLVRYMDALYTDVAFLNSVASDLVIYGENLPYYYSTDDRYTFTQFDGQFLKIINEGDGAIGVDTIETAIEEYTWYTRSGVEGEYVYTPAETSDVLANIASACENFNASWSLIGQVGETINEYNQGLMYYNIPIEHLNESNKTNGVYDGLLEANYGVVRNHWYRLSINSLAHLGRGVVDENEVIVPTIDDTSYIRATVSILPWKLIENTVIF